MESQVVFLSSKTSQASGQSALEQIICLDDDDDDDRSVKHEKITSIQNSEQKVVIQHKKIQKKKQQLKPKQFEIKSVPNLSCIYDIESLFLVGEIFITLDFNDLQLKNTHISYINNFKRIKQTIIHKQTRFIQIDLESTVPSSKYFYNSALKLSNYPKQNIHDLGQLLMIYQQFCFDIYNDLLSLQSIPNLEILFNQQLQELQMAKQTYLNNFKQDEFVYIMQMVNNIETMEFEIQNIYYSEPFLILLGTNLEQYQRFIHRYGLNEFADCNSEINFTKHQLKQMLRMHEKYVKEYSILQDFNDNEYVDVNLYTFDGIKIQTKAYPQIIYPQPSNKQCTQFHFNTHMLIVVKTEIEPTSLKQVLEIRQNQQNSSLDFQDKIYHNEIDFSLDYSLQVEVFQEMAKMYNVFAKKQNNRTSFRLIKQEEKDQINHFNPVCPDLKYY